MEVDIDVIAAGDFALCSSVSACIVGRSVRNHLPTLAHAAPEDFTPTWLELVDVINDIANFTNIGAPAADVDHYLQFARALLDARAKTFEEINPGLASVLRAISLAARKGNAGELQAYFDELQRKGFHLAVECANTWGEKRSRSRASEIKPIALEFFQDDRIQGLTTLKPVNHSKIRVVLGPLDVLRSSLSLEFFFFHEYLSHVFPRNDDIEGKLSEGHLFGVAKRFFQEQVARGKELFAFSPLLSSLDLQQHRKLRSGKGRPEAYYDLLDGLFANLCAICGQEHAAYLVLELAATSPGGDERYQERVVGQLNYLAAHPQHPATRILKNNGLDLDTTARELRRALSPF